MQVTYRGNLKDVPGDRDGRAHVVSGGAPVVYYTSGAAAVSYTTTIAVDYPGRPWVLKRFEWTSDAAPTTSQSVTVTKVARGNITHRQALTSTRPNTLLYSEDPSATAAVALVQTWDSMEFPPGDDITMAFTNTDTNAIAMEIVVEIL